MPDRVAATTPDDGKFEPVSAIQKDGPDYLRRRSDEDQEMREIVWEIARRIAGNGVETVVGPRYSTASEQVAMAEEVVRLRRERDDFEQRLHAHQRGEL